MLRYIKNDINNNKNNYYYCLHQKNYYFDVNNDNIIYIIFNVMLFFLSKTKHFPWERVPLYSNLDLGLQTHLSFNIYSLWQFLYFINEVRLAPKRDTGSHLFMEVKPYWVVSTTVYLGNILRGCCDVSSDSLINNVTYRKCLRCCDLANVMVINKSKPSVN